MPNSPTFQYDVFLSHNSRDKPRVRQLAERLHNAGLRVWFDEWAIGPGDDIYLAVEHGLDASRVQVLCLTPAAFESDWVKLERSTVLFRDPANVGRRFIPLLMADCDMPDTLRRYKYVDLRKDVESAFETLVTACRIQGELSPVASPRPHSEAVNPVSRGTVVGKLAALPPIAKRPRSMKKFSQPSNLPDQDEQLASLEHKLGGQGGWVRGVAISPNGKLAASGSNDGTVKIWNLDSGECQATLKGHTGRVCSVAITPGGERILSGSNDNTIRQWNIATQETLAIWIDHQDAVYAVSALLHERAFSAGNDKTLRIWDVETGRCLRVVRTGVIAEGGTATATSDGKFGLAGLKDGSIEYWNLETGEPLASLKGHSDTVRCVQITPDGRFAVSGSEDKAVKIWALETGKCVGTLEGHEAEIFSVAISPDDNLIASAGFTDKTVRLWDRNSGACLQVIEHRIGASPISVTFSPEGSRLVVGTTNGSILVYRLATVRSSPRAVLTRNYVNAKVVLIGERTVGKTSLAHRLIDDRYVVRDRTHGMNVWRLELPLQAEAAIEREVLLWDLAGQEDYRLIHQLFLEETALAILLVDPQKEDPFAEAGTWLKALQTASNNQTGKRNAALLLVFSQIDVGGMKVGDAKIDRFREQYHFVGWIPTSAKTGENCSDGGNSGKPSNLKQLIAANIPWDKLPWTATPRLLAELRNAVVAMRDKSDIRLLRFAELAQRLEQALPSERFGESEVRTVVTLLANHGLARSLKFGDLVLLRPDLLNGYAAAIIRAARAHEHQIGCVLEAAIYNPAFDFTGVERLKHRPDEELLLRALVQTFLDHSLCIAEETPQGRHLVFPSQFRREKDIPHDPDVFVSYTFGGEWQTIWTTLVVRLWYSQEFKHRELWRNAAEFASAKAHALGLLIEKAPNGSATISLYFDHEVPDELKVIFIEYVHRHLDKYAVDVKRDRRYVCQNCGTPVIDLARVRSKLERQLTSIMCQECDLPVQLMDFIEQLTKSDPVARKILAMDEEATRKLDTQALEQILIGHMMAICGEANQIFRPVTMFDHGVDGEVEFKNNNGEASGKKIYIQLKSGNSYLRTRKGDGAEIFDVKNERHLDFWISQPVDVYLVVRQTDDTLGVGIIRWMNVTRYLKDRTDKASRQIVFEGEKLDAPAVWRTRDGFFVARQPRAAAR